MTHKTASKLSGGLANQKWGNAMKKFIVLFAVALGGCGQIGSEAIRNQTDTSLSQQITKGVTTKNQVRAALGAPSGTSITDSGNEAWYYYSYDMSVSPQSFIPVVGIFAGSGTSKNKTLTVLFDKQGIVINYTFNDTCAQSGPLASGFNTSDCK
jgi:outer membrane protein assembly factor BamE (lipoprotein component of BamABCDE complex)